MPVRTMADDLQYGRECYERGATATTRLRLVDQAAPLADADLQRVGPSAYLIGREPEFERYFDRLYRAQAERGEREQAARSAFWLD